MLIESGNVVAVDDAGLWIDAPRKAHCHRCSSGVVCSSFLQPGRVESGPPIPVFPAGPPSLAGRVFSAAGPGRGAVRLGMAESQAVSLALLLYLLPAAGLVCGSLAAAALGGGEPATVLAGLAGLVLGFYPARRRERQVESGRNHPLMLLDLE